MKKKMTKERNVKKTDERKEASKRRKREERRNVCKIIEGEKRGREFIKKERWKEETLKVNSLGIIPKFIPVMRL